MDRDNKLPGLPGYVSIKEAAEMLGLSANRVYEFVAEGRLPAHRIADAIAIRLEDVKNFERGASGRKRRVIPRWRISSGKDTQYFTCISVQIQSGRENRLMQRLEQIKREEMHLFPGTIARNMGINGQQADHLSIILVWRDAVMHDEATREQALSAFRQDFADVLDWSNATYEHSRILMHT